MENKKTTYAIMILLIVVSMVLLVVYFLLGNDKKETPTNNQNENTDQQAEVTNLELVLGEVSADGVIEVAVKNHKNNFNGIDITLVPQNARIVSFQKNSYFDATLRNEIDSETGNIKISLGVLEKTTDPELNADGNIVVGELTVAGYSDTSAIVLGEDAEGLINFEVVGFNNFTYNF